MFQLSDEQKAKIEEQGEALKAKLTAEAIAVNAKLDAKADSWVDAAASWLKKHKVTWMILLGIVVGVALVIYLK